jgi:uncharacterized protein
MHVLFDLGHPAHVHLFRNVARALIDSGHQVTITIRDRDIIPTLLERYNLPFVVASKARKGFWGLLTELMVHDWNVLRIASRRRVDCLVGTSVSAPHVGWLLRRPSYVFNEDDADYVRHFARLAYSFAHRIIIPDVLRDRHAPKTRRHNSYHELAYLHPNHFTPDRSILANLGLRPDDRFFILRLVSLQAHHDVGERGLSLDLVQRLADILTARGRLFVTAEGKIPEILAPYRFPLPPDLMHHALAFARMIISDSQTMTMEAAVLGTPAVRCNTFAGRCSVLAELEERYGLAWSFHPQDCEAMLRKIEELLDDPDLPSKMAERRQRMLSEKIELSAWILRQLEAGFP